MNDFLPLLAAGQHIAADPANGHILGVVADDWAAVDVWLDAVASNSRRRSNSDETVSTYQYHVAKIRWYCEHVSRRSLSAWDAQEVLRFEAFLADIPAHAVCTPGTKPTEPGYTPFRRQPGASSQADILRCLRALFSALHGAGYLRSNPMRLMKVAKPRRLDKTRAIDGDLFDQVLQVMNAIPLSTQRDHQLHARDRFIFVCLRESGLRASELVGATMQSISPLTDPKTGNTYWVLHVSEATGKGGNGRTVPVSDALLDALVDYRRAFGLPPLPGHGDRQYGLILSVRTQQLKDGISIKTAAGRRFFGQWRDVTTRFGLHQIVKGRLRSAVAALQLAGDTDGANRLKRASPHWLRHTFAMQALLAGQDLRTVATALGHASVSTTMQYTEQDTLDQIYSWEREQPGRIARVQNTGGSDVSSQ